MIRSTNPLYDVDVVRRYRRDRRVMRDVVVATVAFVVAGAVTFYAAILALGGML